MNSIQMNEFAEGMELSELKKTITQENINLYAEASHDFNPIHIDPEFAKKTPLGGTVAHGMLILAYLYEFMAQSFEQDWIRNGSLSARFKGAAYPGDIITVSGSITGVERENDFVIIDCDVLCRNQKGEPVITCSTKVRIKTDEDSN